jgi:hypothetical protein
LAPFQGMTFFKSVTSLPTEIRRLCPEEAFGDTGLTGSSVEPLGLHPGSF